MTKKTLRPGDDSVGTFKNLIEKAMKTGHKMKNGGVAAAWKLPNFPENIIKYDFLGLEG